MQPTGDTGVEKGRTGRIWHTGAAPGSSWHVSGGWLCPFQAGQEVGAVVPCSLPMSPASTSGQEGFSRGTTTQSHRELGERMVLHKYRGVKALEVSSSSSRGGSGSSSLG